MPSAVSLSLTSLTHRLPSWSTVNRRAGIAAAETGGDAGRDYVEAAMEDPNIAVVADRAVAEPSGAAT